jgi:hypothetical protein
MGVVFPEGNNPLRVNNSDVYNPLKATTVLLYRTTATNMCQAVFYFFILLLLMMMYDILSSLYKNIDYIKLSANNSDVYNPLKATTVLLYRTTDQ